MTTQDQAQAPGATGSTNEEETLDLGNDGPGAPEGTAGTGVEVLDIEDDAGKGSKGGGQGIPRARLNEVNERRRQTEEQLAQRERENAELRAQLQAAQAGRQPAAPTPAQPQVPAFDVIAAEREYTSALMEGDGDKAAALREQINQHIEDRALARFESSYTARQVASLTQQVIGEAIEAYPYLDTPDGADAMDAITALRDLKEAEGMPRHQAVAHAINTLAPRFAPASPPSRELQVAAAPVDSRIKAANERGAAHSLMQPPAVQTGMGNRATAPKIDGSTKLTDDQIAGLSQAELDEALGSA